MIDGNEFLRMPPGVAFANKVTEEWSLNVDSNFVDFVIQNADAMDEYKLRHASYLVRHSDSPELRAVMRKFLVHPDWWHRVAAETFFEAQINHGYISEFPDKPDTG